MTLDQACHDLLQQLARQPGKADADQAIRLLDLTLLDQAASERDVRDLEEQAHHHAVAAICIFPEHLSLLANPNACRRATVVNFPCGTASVAAVLQQMDDIIARDLADEIDYVFPWQACLAGERQAALDHCQQACRQARQGNRLFKVIIESGSLPSSEFIYTLSRDLINLGCDFLKTSTGKTATGATVEAAFAMLHAIRDEGNTCGLKLSGGIKQAEQAFLYLDMVRQILQIEPSADRVRLGASSLLNELKAFSSRG